VIYYLVPILFPQTLSDLLVTFKVSVYTCVCVQRVYMYVRRVFIGVCMEVYASFYRCMRALSLYVYTVCKLFTSVCIHY